MFASVRCAVFTSDRVFNNLIFIIINYNSFVYLKSSGVFFLYKGIRKCPAFEDGYTLLRQVCCAMRLSLRLRVAVIVIPTWVVFYGLNALQTILRDF